MEKENRYQEAVAALKKYVQDLLDAAGTPSSESLAQSIVDFETKLAGIQWSQVELRDPIKTYNKIAVSEFDSKHSHLGWKAFSTSTGLPQDGSIIVGNLAFSQGSMNWLVRRI